MLDKIKGKLIVSCQALPDEPLFSSYIMSRMSVAAKEGGAVAIRAQSKEDILEIEKVCELPIIGIVKRNYEGSEVYITPTKKEVDELLETGCEMIALDATKRIRPHGEKLQDLVDTIHQNNRLAMADCSTLEECIEAEKLGFDVVSTTLCGYTSYSENIDGPNFDLLKEVAKSVHVPLIAEGKINTPEDLAACIELGAYAVVVGGAITRPKQITERFVNALK
ncbi:MAG: N-acetylmannosamine-6-phosphate 2-epimerase [Anaerorhabdus sp.]|uniref:N-acetylmannosamine-6-phosphate 2-epimerase n=1 Tax=Anaerorhabdus sp. TaxID=1872524 RepID=UPI003A8BE697